MTAAGAIVSMLIGFLVHLSLYLVGNGFEEPMRPFELDPVVVGIGVSFLAGILTSFATKPPPRDLVLKYFYRRKADAGTAPQST
jgi:Na+/proline symporter